MTLEQKQQATYEWLELHDIVEHWERSFEELCVELGGHNFEEDLFDINYKMIVGTITNKNGKISLSKNIEIWSNEDIITNDFDVLYAEIEVSKEDIEFANKVMAITDESDPAWEDYQDLKDCCVETFTARFKNGYEAAMLAPTAMNQQKFHIGIIDGEPAIKVSKKGSYTSIDLGIVKCHFEIGSGRKVM